MAEVLVIGGAVSALLQTLVVNIDYSLKEEFRLLGSVKKEMEGLKRILMMVQALLLDAEERHPSNNTVALWLRELKHVAYEAEDVMDEVTTNTLKWTLEDDASEERIKKGSHCFSCSTFSYQPIFKRTTTLKVKRIKEKFDGTLDTGHRLGLRTLEINTHVQSLVWRQTSSLPEENVVGRDEARDQMARLLLEGLTQEPESSNTNVAVVAIVGIAGVGKTTLAQLLYNDTRVKDHFELMMWVCVSYDFNVQKLTREFIESATQENLNEMTFNNLQVKLNDILSGKRFLLVLDDVWNTDKNKWENLRKPLIHGGKGSKILITTRSHTVAEAMGVMNNERIPLGGLPYVIFKPFFEKCAFGSKEVADGHPRLREIGGEIAVKLGGYPLAAKTLGRLLNTNLDVAQWTRIKESELWQLPQEETDILPTLQLSYQHLPAPLKRCFAYCSVFPKDHRIHRSTLIQMWMAHDFIQGAPMEEIGSQYVDDLLHRCFLQKVIGEDEVYIMHDLIHDLARSVSMNEYFAICDERQLAKIPIKVRHISCLTSPQKELQNVSNLRSLLYLNFPHQHLNRTAFDIFLQNLFARSNCLRVLDLCRCNLESLPESISNLIHLRYLDLSCNVFAHLPESLGTLYNLQTLKLEKCSYLCELPRATTKLINLRHLCGSQVNLPFFRIAGVNKLKFIRDLKAFWVSKEKGSNIGELKPLAELRGLGIWNLQKVESKREASSAELTRKPHLAKLTLGWQDEREDGFSLRKDDSDEEVLEGLEPHSNLIWLMITGYGGLKSPSWLENKTCSHLQTLILEKCSRWEVLPPLGQLHSLKYLRISWMGGVKKISQQFYGTSSGRVEARFPSLEWLDIGNMPDLKEWVSCEEEGSQWFPILSKLDMYGFPKLRALPHLGQMPCLKELKISQSPRIESIPRLPPSLQDLYISQCPLLLERCNESSGADWPNIVHVPHKDIS